MVRVTKDAIFIESPSDLEAEMCRYNCKTEEELYKILWYYYGVTLVIEYKKIGNEYIL